MLAWVSPAYPVGGFAYAHGLEAAIEAGGVSDRASLETYVAWVLTAGAGKVDAGLFAHAFAAAADGDDSTVDAIVALAAAWRGTAELAAESERQGAAFLLATMAAWDGGAGLARFVARHGGTAPVLAHPIALALATAGLVPLDLALTAYLQGFAAMIISAGLRLVPLGQTDGQRALRAVVPVIAETARRAPGIPLDRLGSAAPLIDIASMRHETQYTRLFRS